MNLNAANSEISWLWSDGEFRRADSVPLTDRGFRYGMSVFESIRASNKSPLFFSEHATRLQRACDQCGFLISPNALAAAGNLLRENGDGFARIYVTAGDGPVVTSDARLVHSRIFVVLEPREPVAAEIYARGYALALAPEPHRPIFGGLKTANYWANAHALSVARSQGCDEALLFNEDGGLISACMANLFVVRPGKILTPPLESGARDGVVRAWVMTHVEVEEQPIRRADLANADEIFLTNSWIGVMPASSLEGRTLESRTIAAELLKKYPNAATSRAFATTPARFSQEADSSPHPPA